MSQPLIARAAPRGILASLFAAFLTLAPPPALAHLSLIQQGGSCAGALEAGDRLGEALAVGDFNGDGYDDVAMGAPGEDVGGAGNAGAVIVSFGSSFGITHAGSFAVTANTIGQTSLAGARFGHALASGDFNLDGYDDLVIGAPYENVGPAAAGGRVYIVYGNPGGLNPTSIALDETNAGGGLETNDRFGFSLAVGNFDGAGYPDLAIGAPGEDNYAGAVAVNFFGGPLGLTWGLATFIKQSSIGGANEANDEFGRSLAAGNVAGSAHDDLVVGAPYETLGNVPEQGAAWVLRGSVDGITTASSIEYGAGSKDFAQSYGHFGYALAVGHFFSGSYQSVAIGEPGRHLGNQLQAGRVVVAKGGTSGLDFAGTNGRILTEDSGGLNSAETNDRFGQALAAGEFGAPDGYDDVAIGAPQDGFGVSSLLGNFIVFPGGSTGPTGSGWSGFNQGTCNEPAEPNDEFAWAIAFGRFDATNKGGFVVGAPGERYEDIHCAADVFLDDAGMVHVIAPWRQAYGLTYKSSAAMDCEGNLVFTQKPFERVKIASTTKALTVLMACEAIQGGQVSQNLVYTVPAWVNDQIGGSQVPLQTGEQMTLLNLMYTGMMVSGNDAMHAIADILGTGATSTARVTDFANDMNARAAAIGMGGSHFHNPAGLDGNPIGGNLGDHYSTAFDMALLSRASMQNSLFRQVVGTNFWPTTRVVPGPDFQQTFSNFINNVLNNVQNSTGIKGGGTPCAATTGIYSARPPLSAGQAVATWFGSPQNSAAETGTLLGLGMAQCNFFIPQVVFQEKIDYTFANLWARAESTSGSVVDLRVPSAGRDSDVQFDVFRQDGSGRGAADLQLWRMAEVLVGPGQTRRFGIAPFSSHDGLTFMNMGSELVRLRLTSGIDGAVTDVTLGPGERHLVLPYASPSGIALFTMDVMNLATGGAPAHLSAEQVYDFALLAPEGAASPAFSARLLRQGDEVNDQACFVIRGRDSEGDTRLFLAIHDPSITVGVGQPPGGAPAGPALQMLTATPNPFVQRTRLTFDLRRSGQVSAAILDVRGRRVKQFPEARLEPGRWHFDWDGAADAGHAAPAGVYFYRVRLDGTDAAGGRVVLTR